MNADHLVDIEAIRQLKARYFRTMDQKDWDSWEQVFCEDAVIDTTQDSSPLIESRQAFRDFLPPILENVVTIHHGHSSEITITSDTTAEGIWPMEDMLWWPQSEGGRHLWGTGWYYEEYRKEADGQWRIAKMTLRRARVEVDGQQVFPPA